MKNFKFGKKTTVTKLIMKCLPDVEMSFRKIQWHRRVLENAKHRPTLLHSELFSGVTYNLQKSLYQQLLCHRFLKWWSDCHSITVLNLNTTDYIHIHTTTAAMSSL